MKESIKSILKPWINKYGMVEPWKNRGSRNMSVYTTESIIMLQDYGEFTESDRLELIEIFEEQFQEEGLLWAYPGNKDQVGIDDYLSVCTSSFNLQAPHLAKEIHNNGSYRGCINFVYNNSNPNRFTFRSWLGRHLSWVCHMKICINHEKYRPNAWYQFWWRHSIRGAMKSDHEDSWLHSYQLCRIVLHPKCHKYETLIPVAKEFMKAVDDRWGYIGYVRGLNFNKKNPLEHPLGRFYGK